MNKSVDERLVPNGEYIDAMNVRMGSTELSEIGVIENTKGNEKITTLEYLTDPLSSFAVCIGAFEDGARETIYWFVHDPANPVSPISKVDMIVSYNVATSALRYHVITERNGPSGTETTLNFNPSYLMNGINMVDDLLFFTDDYNPPRFININKNYLTPSGGVDQIIPEEILVIKAPPEEVPIVTPLISVSDDNFMQDRFICFAYRYRYEDNQYSATSQFSQPAFIPGPFGFTPDSFLNSGMQNLATNATIQIETGNFLVKGIDILFKEASSNIIKVIVKLDKGTMSIPDNTTYTYTFGDSKIFTILPDSEILRLYDNVPRYAKAQTVMGNRLVYGNYVEGYDMASYLGFPVNIDYTTQLISNGLEDTTLTTASASGVYSIDVPTTVPDAGVLIDLTSQLSNLVEGAVLNIDFSLTHAQFTSGTIPVQTQDIQVSFSYTLPQNFASVSAMVSSPSFQNAIGTVLNIQPLGSCGNGNTLTDRFNCTVPQNLSTYTKVQSGITAPLQPVFVNVPTLTPNSIYMFFPAVEFFDSVAIDTVYEYYRIQEVEATFQVIGDIRSLHSNRGYEVGIVYMDEFGRSTTPFVSNQNTVFVPCENAELRNRIRVFIPTTQVAPFWAKRYKFFIKQDLENYETIYSNIYFNDPNNNSVWFLLDGENAQKVEEGDRLIVKADTSGPVNGCVYATILEKKVQPVNFITTVPSTFVPSGLYVRILPTNFNAVKDPDAYVDLGFQTVTAEDDRYPLMKYGVTKPGTTTHIDIPAGSRVRFYIEFYRRGTGDGNKKCERRKYTLEKFLISSNSYPSFYSFFVGEDVQSILNDGTQDIGDGSCNITNIYDPNVRLGPLPTTTSCPYGGGGSCTGVIDVSTCTAEYRFNRDTTTFAETLMVAGGVWACGDNSRREAKISMHIEIFRATDLIIFETQPSDTLPDIFYESSQSFSIDSLGQHSGNVQSQNIPLGAPAIIDTDFYNCYTFGNGAESYKILDSAAGKQFNLGNRVTATSSKDYMEVDRYFDLTYSGIYNDESNVNRLNEFNLGLLNYKPLENSFGSIEKLFGRETDILVLQEDKISYVLAGKNLLSDAAAGGAITSVPEVLGTQIARLEDYGISKNPESFAVYGYDKYFTDSKRGAVLKLMGSSYSNEQLGVVSESGMRTWFRDLFIDSFQTQKLGGYDPYMNEYVLSSNNNLLPIDDQCQPCNSNQTLQIVAPNSGTLTLATTLCFEYGNITGDVTVTITYDGDSKNDILVEADYDGNTYSTGPIQLDDIIVFPKNNVNVTNGLIRIYVEEDSIVGLNVSCPTNINLNVVQVCVTNNSRVGEYIHNEYSYSDFPYVSPTLSTLVQIAPVSLTPMVSYYSVSSGSQGASFIPSNGSTVTMRSNKILFDNFQFNPSGDFFRFLRTNVNYLNTPGDISLLLAAAGTATPTNTIGAPNLYTASFTMPTLPPTDNYLYLIWDYRAATQSSLCYSAVSANDACCDCICVANCSSYVITVFADNAGSNKYTKCDGTPIDIPVTAGQVFTVCVDNTAPPINFPTSVISLLNCGCTDDQPKPNSFTQLGNYYNGYTEPYQQYTSYTPEPIQDSVCQAFSSPLATSTLYSFTQFYTETGYFVPAFGMQLYTDNLGTLSTFNGILIFTAAPDILPFNISTALIVYVVNGIIAGVVPASNYTPNC